MPTREQLDQGFRLGDWAVYPRRHVMQRGDSEVEPEPIVFKCLISLAMRDGDTVTKDMLVEEVWNGRFVADDSIVQAIKGLRAHLGDRRPFRYIKAVTGEGYRLLMPVELLSPQPDTGAAATAGRRAAGRWRWGMVGAAAAVIAIVLWRSFVPPPPAEVRIGILPFDNASADPAREYIAEGFRSALIQTLHPVPDLAVINGRVTYPDKTPVEVANLLGVDNVLSGVVQEVNGNLKVSYELASGSDGSILASDSVTGNVERLFDLQEELADKVRTRLFGERPRHLISASRPSNWDAYQQYLRGLFAFERRGSGENFDDAIAHFRETIRLDPDFGPAYLQLATAYALLPAYRGADPDESGELALDTLEDGIRVDTSIVDAAGAVQGFIYHNRKEWADAEIAYEKATNARIVDSNAFNWYSRMLASVGRLGMSRDVALQGLKLDPENPVMNSRVALAYSWLGDTANGHEYFERAKVFGAEGTTHLMGYALFLFREGLGEASSDVAKVAASNAGFAPEWIDAVIAGVQNADFRSAALESVDQTVAAGQMNAQIEVVVRTLLGDLDRAMDVARRLKEPGEAFEMDLLWIPEFRALRERPDFLELMRDLGVVDYWSLRNCEFVDADVACAGG